MKTILAWLVVLYALYPAVAGAAPFELPQFGFSDLKEENTGVPPPAVTPVPQDPTAGGTIDQIIVANEKLAEAIGESDLSPASDALQKALRQNAIRSSVEVANMKKAFDEISSLRREPRLATKEKIFGILNERIASMQKMLEINAFAAALQIIRTEKPYSGADLGLIALQTSHQNLMLAIIELMQETSALSRETGILDRQSQETMGELIAKSQEQWIALEEAFAELQRGAPEFAKTRMKAIKALRVFATASK